MDEKYDEDIENGYCESCIYDKEAERCHECDEDFSEYNTRREMNNKIIQSYVFHKEKRYFVSTIERDSSAMTYPHRYNETIVWEWKEGEAERGKMLLQDDDIKGSIKKHLEICSNIYENGISQ